MALKDKRYSVKPEWTNKPKKEFVVRFNDDVIDCFPTRDLAEKCIAKHKKEKVS